MFKVRKILNCLAITGTTKRLLFIASILIAITFYSSYAEAARRLYYQGFEDSGDSWKGPNDIETRHAVKVSHAPRSGSYSLRGNLNRDVIDPITGVRGDPWLGGAELVNSSLRLNTPNEVYVSYWFRLDDCKQSGPSFSSSDPIYAGMKGAYLTMGDNTSTSIYTGWGGGARGEFRLGFNDGNGTWTPWALANGWRSAFWGETGQPWGWDGRWHRFEMHIRYGTTRSIAKFWIDGHLVKGTNSFFDGAINFPPDYHLDQINFWYTAQELLSTSTNRTGYCNGWQIDDIEVWDGYPNAPSPPTNLTVR